MRQKNRYQKKSVLPFFKTWLQAFRPFSYPASMVPVAAGSAWAALKAPEKQWSLLPLVLLASLLIHTGTNLVNDYFDFKNGVDRPETLGSGRMLTDNLLSPLSVLRAGLICFALAALIGAGFVYIRGWPMLILGGAGLLGGFFYTAPPVAYKYSGWGDLLIFLLTGPMIVIGSYFVLSGTFDVSAVLISIPIGFLATAVLSANNLRDLQYDTQAGIRTTASWLGHRRAVREYVILTAGAYFSVAILVVSGVLSPFALITGLSLPLALKQIREAQAAQIEKPDQIAFLDKQTARLHLLFGILLTASIIAQVSS